MSDVPAPRPLGRRLVIAVICVAVVVVGGVLLRSSSFDLTPVQSLNTGHVGIAAAVGDIAYRVVGPVPAIVGTAVITALILLIRRDLAVASTFAVTIAVTWLSSAVVKVLVGRPRPEGSMLPHPPALQADASYPSGHVVFVTALVVTAILLTDSVALRRVWVIVGVLAILAITLCVLSDGVHFPTDVTASIAWAVGVAPLTCVLWQRIVLPRLPFLRPRIPGSPPRRLPNQTTRRDGARR
jgi:undecaprenyl-diphosphatase